MFVGLFYRFFFFSFLKNSFEFESSTKFLFYTSMNHTQGQRYLPIDMYHKMLAMAINLNICRCNCVWFVKCMCLNRMRESLIRNILVQCDVLFRWGWLLSSYFGLKDSDFRIIKNGNRWTINHTSDSFAM